MMSVWLYYLWAILLLLGNCGAWFLSLLTLPGNWIIVGFVAMFAWLLPAEQGRGISWTVVGILVLLAVLGEIVEFVAGAAGAARQGGSRRGMVLSVVGAVIGSFLGVVIGVPIPIIGSAIGAVGGGAVGALLGAYLGERWKGRSLDEGLEIGRAALVGRVFGTMGKLIIGAVMVVLATADSFF